MTVTEIAIFNQITEAADRSDHQLAKILDFTDDPRISDCLTVISTQQKIIKEMITDFDTSIKRFFSSLREGKKPKHQIFTATGTPTMCRCDLCLSHNTKYSGLSSLKFSADKGFTLESPKIEEGITA